MKAKPRRKQAPKPSDFIQLAAIPWRRGETEDIEVLLVTSRETGRWVIPKGWPMKGKKPFQAAATEALEEAGVIGKVARKPAGSFEYWKRREDHFDLCSVKVYLMEFKAQAESWRERGQRQHSWVSPLRSPPRTPWTTRVCSSDRTPSPLPFTGSNCPWAPSLPST